MIAAQRKANEDRRAARAVAMLAEEPKHKKQKQTKLDWAGTGQDAPKTQDREMAATPQSQVAEGNQSRKTAASREQRKLTEWATVQKEKRGKSAPRGTGSTGTAGRRRTNRRERAARSGRTKIDKQTDTHTDTQTDTQTECEGSRAVW